MTRAAARPALSRPVLEAFEPRILYAADLLAVSDALLSAAPAWAGERSVLMASSAITATPAVAGVEIVLLDLGVPDAHTLLAGLLAQREAGRAIEVLRVDAGEDGLALLSAQLATHAPGSVSAVHLISHGSAGAVQLGSTTLDASSVLGRAGELAGWGSALSADADLLIYGCDVAASAPGLALIDALAALTGADVAASNDRTGAAALGGDWVLEQHSGDIQTAVALSLSTQQAWLGTLPTDRQVNATLDGQQDTEALNRGSQQAVALDAAGNFVVVWTSKGQDGSADGVYARRFAADGTALTGDILVNQTTDTDQNLARVVSDDAGNFVVAWASDKNSSDVYFRRFNAAGVALTGELRANSTVDGTQTNPVLAINSSTGAFVVAWQGSGPGDSEGVFFRRFAADGTAIDPTDRRAHSSSSGTQANPAVAMDSSGRFVIAFDVGDHMYFQRFNAEGAVQGAVTQVDNALSTSTGAAIAMDSAGNFTLVYREQNTLTGVWGRGYNVDGTQRFAWFHPATGDATSPSIDFGSDGSFVVTYQKAGSSGQDIYAAKFKADGSADGSAFVVNQETDNDQVAPSVAVRTTNNFVVVWSGRTAADNKGVALRVYTGPDAPVISSLGGGDTASISVAENSSAVTTVTATDASLPAPTLHYSVVGGADAARFSMGANSGALSFITAPNFELPASAAGSNSYSVIVQVSDGTLVDTQTLTVTVSDVNEPAIAVDDSALASAGSPVTLDVLANDLMDAGDTLQLLDWTLPAHGSVTRSGQQLIYTATAGYAGNDSFRYQVIDASSAPVNYWKLDGSGTDSVGSRTATLVNGPTTVAGVYGSALRFDGLNDQVRLGDVAYGNSFSLSLWFKVDGNAGTGYDYLYSHGDPDSRNSVNVYFIEASTNTGSGITNVLRTSVMDGNDSYDLSGLDVSATGLTDGQWHQYTLTTQTGVGSKVYVDGVLRRADSNGGDAINPVGSAVVGGNTTGDTLRLLDGSLDSVAVYGQALSADTVAAQYLAAGAPGASSATVSLTVTAQASTPPTITSDGGYGMALLGVTEGQTVVTTVRATDADLPAPTLTYSLVGGDDMARFSVDASTGVLSFRTAPDFEAPTDVRANNLYHVEVQVSDGQLTDTQYLVVGVRDSNEFAVTAPTDTDTQANQVSALATVGSTVGLTAHAVDADGSNNTVTYALSNNGGGLFSINARTGVVSLAALLDAATAASHTLTVVARSSDGSQSTADFTVNVLAAPVVGVGRISDSNSADNRVAENAAAGTLVGLTASAETLGGTPSSGISYSLGRDASSQQFVIDAQTGVVRTAAPLDAEAGLLRSVDVIATASDGSSHTQRFTVAVDDISESAVGALSDSDSTVNAVREDAAVGTAVGITAWAQDADISHNTVSYTLSDSAAGRFQIDAQTGRVTLAQSITEQGLAPQSIEVLATSADGSSARLRTTVNIVAANTEVPVFTSSPSAHLDEDSGTWVMQVQATDADRPAPSLSYTLDGGADAALFTLDRQSGELRFVRTPDFEAPQDRLRSNRYELVVAVSDGELVARQVLQVWVHDVNDAPVVSSNALIVSDGSVTLVLLATDADTATEQLRYGVSQTQGGQFETTLAPGEALTSFTQAEVDAGLVRFVGDDSGQTPVHVLTLTDGHSSQSLGSSLLQQAVPTPDVTDAEWALAPIGAGLDNAAYGGAASGQTASSDTTTSGTTSGSGNSANTSTSTSTSTNNSTRSTSGTGSSADGLGDDGVPMSGEGAGGDTASARAASRLAGLIDGAPPAAGVQARAGLASTVAGAATLSPGELVAAVWTELRLALPSEDLGLGRSANLLGDGEASRSSLMTALDHLRRQVQDDAAGDPTLTLGSSTLVTTGLSVGYVLWLARGGVLVASLMSSVPTWAGMDPLPVLAQMRRDNARAGEGSGAADDDHTTTDDSDELDPIEQLFSRARRLVQRPAEVMAPSVAAPAASTPSSATSSATPVLETLA